MSLIATLYKYTPKLARKFDKDLIKGIFAENVIYDEYKEMGYCVNLLKTKNKDKPQRFTEDKNAIIPDIRIEKYSPKIEIEERFFIECKARYNSDFPFSIKESTLTSYKKFYEEYYPKLAFTTVSENDTFLSFVNVNDSYNNSGFCTIYMCSFVTFDKYKKLNEEKKYYFPENKLKELESWNVLFSYDENDIYTHACPTGVMSHKRKTEILEYPFVYDFD